MVSDLDQGDRLEILALSFYPDASLIIVEIVKCAASAGARVVKAPQETFWGGFSGHFADLDGHYWEVAWGPMFEFAENGDMRFKEDAT